MRHSLRAALADCAERFEPAGQYDRLLVVCRTPTGDLDAPDGRKVQVWTRGRLAERTLRTGPYDWLMERMG